MSGDTGMEAQQLSIKDLVGSSLKSIGKEGNVEEIVAKLTEAEQKYNENRQSHAGNTGEAALDDSRFIREVFSLIPSVNITSTGSFKNPDVPGYPNQEVSVEWQIKPRPEQPIRVINRTISGQKLGSQLSVNGLLASFASGVNEAKRRYG